MSESRLTDLSNVQFVNPSKISKHLECPICSTFYLRPFRLSCGHTFCKECLDGLRKAVQPFQQLRCAECRVLVDLRYVSEDLIAKLLIEEQYVFCLNKSKCCIWKGPLSQIEGHLNACNFKETDEISQVLIDKFEKGVKESVIGSDLNTTSFDITIIDEKLQENLNKNVGESLLVRLMNKNKQMAQNIDNSESKASSTVIKKASKICSTDNSEQKSSQTVLITRSQKKAEGYRDEIEDNFSDEDSNFEDNLTKEDTQKVSEKDDVDDLLEYFSTQEENKTQEDNSAINQIKQLTKPKRGRASKKEPKQKPPPKKKVGRKRKIEYPLEDPELGMQQFEDYDDLL